MSARFSASRLSSVPKPSAESVSDFKQHVNAIKDLREEPEVWRKKSWKAVKLFIGLLGCEAVGWLLTAIPFLWEFAPAEAAVDGVANTGIVLRVLFLAYQVHKWSKVHRNDPLLRVSN